MEREKLADVPSNCSVKIGWKSGSAISFDCVFEKNGAGDVFEEIEKGIENAGEIVFFIYGLNPKVFYYNPQLTFDELKPGKFFISFKLKRDAKVK